MRASANQLVRIRELAFHLEVAEQTIVDCCRVKVLSDLNDVGAGRVIRALLDMPPSPKQPDRQFRHLFAKYEPNSEIRPPTPGEGWVEYTADVCVLPSTHESCPRCRGAGFVERPPGKGQTAQLLLGLEVGYRVSSAMLADRLEKAQLADLQRIAGCWFHGDLNLTAQFVGHLISLIRGGHEEG